MKKIKFFFIVVFIVIVEIILNFSKPSPYVTDSELGWVVKKNFSHIYNQIDFNDRKYKSKYQTNSFGARFYKYKIDETKLNSKTIKILVLGDSFTMDPYASNEQMWFAVLAKRLGEYFKRNVEINAFGGGAYGTLQEYLVVKREKNNMKNFHPDFLILQFCNNDFYNNYFQLEKNGYYISQYMRRPYLLNDKIFYYDSFFSYLFRGNYFTRDSRLFAKLIFFFEIGLRKILIKNTNNDQSYVSESKIITLKLLEKIRQLYSNIPAFIFSCSDSNDEINKDWKKIAHQANFKILKDPSTFVDKARTLNKNFLYKDGGHLNDLGNLKWGEEIFRDLLKSDLLIKKIFN